MKVQTLNASLRLMHHLEHNQTLPDSETLLEHLEAERRQHRMALEAVDEDVALGWRYTRWKPYETIGSWDVGYWNPCEFVG